MAKIRANDNFLDIHVYIVGFKHHGYGMDVPA